jgi:hypothetical protein
MTLNTEIRLDAVIRHLGRDDIERGVRRNARAMRFEVNDEHLAVIRSLIEHYRHDGMRRPQTTHLVRVLDEAYEFLGGRAYLCDLFRVAGAHELLALIHALAGLPPLEAASERRGAASAPLRRSACHR